MFIPLQIQNCIFIYSDCLYQFVVTQQEDGDVYDFINLDLDTYVEQDEVNALLRHLAALSLQMNNG